MNRPANSPALCDPKSAQAFANMPIVIVGYSGGFLPTAWSLDVGGATNRVRGVFLLDAIYGELDKFASWIANNRSGFFVSSYTRYTKPRDRELISMLRDKGITVTENMDGPLRPGSVVFVQTPVGVTHRDYVTQAWTENPVKEVLVKIHTLIAVVMKRDAAVRYRVIVAATRLLNYSAGRVHVDQHFLDRILGPGLVT